MGGWLQVEIIAVISYFRYFTYQLINTNEACVKIETQGEGQTSVHNHPVAMVESFGGNSPVSLNKHLGSEQKRST